MLTSRSHMLNIAALSLMMLMTSFSVSTQTAVSSTNSSHVGSDDDDANVGTHLTMRSVTTSAAEAGAYNDTTEYYSNQSVSATYSSKDVMATEFAWKTFKTRFSKTYRYGSEEISRQGIWDRNRQLIQAHNAEAALGKHGYTLADNHLSDLTRQEYAAMLGFRSTRRTAANATSRTASRYSQLMPVYSNTEDVDAFPTCVNWTEHGWVGPVMNQGICGSCWSFAATGSLQSQYYNYSGQMVQLSQQNLIDCSFSQGNAGCDGGNMQNAFWYVQTNGIESLAAYPNTSPRTGSAGGTCAFNANLSVTKIVSWRDVEQDSELALQQAVTLVGPVSAALDASSKEFQNYNSGVYSSKTCGSTDDDLNHAVLVVGYGIYGSQPYWLIQNSWGKRWGINGYMMLARNADNMCGIATDASFPVVGQSLSAMSGVAVISPASPCPSMASAESSASTPSPSADELDSSATSASSMSDCSCVRQLLPTVALLVYFAANTGP